MGASCSLNVEDIRGEVLILVFSQLREFSDGEKQWKEIGNWRNVDK